MSKIYQNQPLKIKLNTGIDLNTIVATVTDIECKKPDGSIETWTGSIATSDAKRVEYDAVKDVDLDQVGFYSLQTIVDDGVTGPWPGDSVIFEVHARHT